MSTEIAQASKLFVSYAHSDNDLFGDAVKSLVDDLKGFYSIKTGNELVVFFDRESIGWGDNWRSQIDGELENASIFMPVITMQYFNRPACRDELNAFNQSAKRIGAQYLILPVVIAGANFIRADHSIPEVATIESLQYRNLEEAFLAGRGTQEWRRAVSGLADELIELISRAEMTAPEPAHRDIPGGSDTADSGPDEDGDFLADMAELEEMFPNIQRETEQVLSDLNSWTEAVQDNSSRMKPGLSAQQMRAASASVAAKLKAPSEALQDSGVKLAESVERADALINSIKEQISQLEDEEQRESLLKHVTPSQDSEDLHGVVDSMAGILESMQPVEVMSAALRKALKPARIGITKIQDAVRTVDRWGQA
ncbi:toll/interleukin-1 receptor domain-containing protein [Streptomyces sp. SudanB66_2053]|uniref:toll/interleukin-1 receptor domain-containing protein n=1 Tax=Streptomyces sp. SudanB66_2053 TaxID=3035277 RepID=UPI003F55EBB7